MGTATTTSGASPDALLEARKELDEAIARLMRGERDPEAMRKACERMDRMREELRSRIGTVELAAELIREALDR